MMPIEEFLASYGDAIDRVAELLEEYELELASPPRPRVWPAIAVAGAALLASDLARSSATAIAIIWVSAALIALTTVLPRRATTRRQ